MGHTTVMHTMLLLMILHAFKKILECLRLARNCKGTAMIKPKFFLNLVQQFFKQRITKIASRYYKPPLLWTNINSQAPFWNIRRWIRALTVLLIQINIHIAALQSPINSRWNSPGWRWTSRTGLVTNCCMMPPVKKFLKPDNLSNSIHLASRMVIHG